jgi:hypothetical protein
MNIKHYILIISLLWSVQLYAQNAKLTASVSKNEVGTGEPFEVAFSINGNADGFTPPDFNGFQVVGGPNQSSSMESFNGRTTVTSAFSYQLVAVKEGDYTIGTASVVVNGRKLTSNTIRIKVVKGRPAPQNNANQGAGQQVNSPPIGSTADLSKSLFIRAVVDKDNVYQGQQLTLSYRIYTRVGIVQSQVLKLPDLTGFWNEDVKVSGQPAPWRVETYKGLKYNVADIKQVILFPEHAGNLTIDPFEMAFVARIAAQAKDVIEQFFSGGSQDVRYNTKSLPTVVHVKPLPSTGKPDSFAGAVGNFSIDATIDKNHLKANEALNYKIKVTGSGNIKLLKSLSTNFPIDFEKYDPKITDTVKEDVAGVSGTRFYNYLLIPRHQGDFTIDPLKFSYFNPTTGRYVNLSTKSFKVKVDKGLNESNVTALAGADKQDVKLLDKDIRYIKTGDLNLQKDGNEFFGSIGYYLLLLLGPFVALAAVIYRNQNQKYNSDVVKVKSRRAGKIAAKRLANAQKQLLSGNSQVFYEAIFKGLYGYLSDKLNITAADLNKETIASALKERSLSDDSINQLMDTLDLCEMARYSPVTHISEKQVFEKSKGIISNIEDEI